MSAVAEPFVMLAAGGTGGHLFPAEALAAAFATRGIACELATDSRAARYAKDFPARAIHALPSATPSGGSIFTKLSAGVTLLRGAMKARGLIGAHRPAAIVGFGGYPCVPPVLAGVMKSVPTILHEQNGVMGRANAFLASRVTALATGFPDVQGITPELAQKTTHVGNPVRPAVLAAVTPFVPLEADGRFHLLVFGGSQGARVMSEVVPEGVALLPDALRARLSIVQQARPEDIERVRAIYAAKGVEAILEPFFKDLPVRMAASHLVIARSGASTVAELGVLGRPSVLVPLPGSLDQDQAANAKVLGTIGAAEVVLQPDFTPQRVAEVLSQRLLEPAQLTAAAAAAKSAGIPDAADRLAALVARVAHL